MLTSSALSPFLAIFLMAAQGQSTDAPHDARREFAPAIVVPTPMQAAARTRAPVPSEVEEPALDKSREQH